MSDPDLNLTLICYDHMRSLLERKVRDEATPALSDFYNSKLKRTEFLMEAITLELFKRKNK